MRKFFVFVLVALSLSLSAQAALASNTILDVSYGAITQPGAIRFFVTDDCEFNMWGAGISGTESYTNVEDWLERAAQLYGGSELRVAVPTGDVRVSDVSRQTDPLDRWRVTLDGRNLSGGYEYLFSASDLGRRQSWRFFSLLQEAVRADLLDLNGPCS